MTELPGIQLTYKCPKCGHSHTTEVPMSTFYKLSKRELNGTCLFKDKPCPKCEINKKEFSEFLVTSGTRAVVNWYKVLITLQNDLQRIREYIERNKNEIHNFSDIQGGKYVTKEGIEMFYGDVTNNYIDSQYIEELITGLHDQYLYSMLGIIIFVSDKGHPLNIPDDIKGYKNPISHWEKKRHIMTDIWWDRIQKMLLTTPSCNNKDCAICSRYEGEDWHDVAPHIGQCDFYGRFHNGTDIVSLSWVQRTMITASYWDELGNKNAFEVMKAKRSIGRACIDVVLGKDGDFDQRIAKLRCLLNLNTYTLRRSLLESRFRAENGQGAFGVGKFENLAMMIRGRLFEGMTLPYVEEIMQLLFKYYCPCS
jgi:hypothetical protein